MAFSKKLQTPDLTDEELLEGDTSAEVSMDDDEEQEQEYVEGPNGDIIARPIGSADAVDKSGIGWFDNLAAHMEDSDLGVLCTKLVTLFDADDQSRSDWKENYIKGLKLLGLRIEERSEPWDGASGVFHPLLSEALVRYTSEAILELYPATGPAETSIIGDADTEMTKRARRVKDEMNYYCTVKMPEDRAELESTLWRQALAGVCLRKVYYDPVLGRPTRRMVPAEDFVINYGATDLITSPRYTHIMRSTVNDVMKAQAVGFYIDYDPAPSASSISEVQEEVDELNGQTKSTFDDEDELELLEMYVDVDLAGFEHKDGIALPYIITIDKTSDRVIAIYRNHSKERPFHKLKTCFAAYKYLTGFGFYGTGLVQLLGGVTESATSILRQLIDAGTISNIPSGFKSRALRIKGDSTPLRPGELRDVDVPPGMVKGSIEWAPTREPSVVLSDLLNRLVDEGRRIGSVSDMKIADSNAESPVGTTLALIERHMRVISAVQARNNIAMGDELRMLKDLILEDGEDQYEYPVEGNYSRSQDFGPPVCIIPVADPAATTQSQRIMRYSAAIDMAARAPEHYDNALLHRGMIDQIGLPNPDKIVPLQDEFKAEDPVTENMKILMMRPVKVFVNQDHEAHLIAHTAAVQDPLMAAQVGQSPNAAAIMAAAQAHILEHVAYAYREKMQAAMGTALPTPDQTMPPEMEAGASHLIAAAAQKVLQQDQAQAASQAAAAQAADPETNLKMIKIAQDGKIAEDKKEMMAEDLDFKRERLVFDDHKLELETKVDLAKIDQLDRSMENLKSTEEKRIKSQETIAGAQIGHDSVKHAKQLKQDAINHDKDTEVKKYVADKKPAGPAKKPAGKAKK